MAYRYGTEFCVHREAEYLPPTRQTMAEKFIQYVRKLSPLVHQKYRYIKVTPKE